MATEVATLERSKTEGPKPKTAAKTAPQPTIKKTAYDELRRIITTCARNVRSVEKAQILNRKNRLRLIWQAGEALSLLETKSGQAEFEKICATEKVKGRENAPRLMELILRGQMSDGQRAEWAAAMLWMRNPDLCNAYKESIRGAPEDRDDPDVIETSVVEDAYQFGGTRKMDASYRAWVKNHGKEGDFCYPRPSSTAKKAKKEDVKAKETPADDSKSLEGDDADIPGADAAAAKRATDDKAFEASLKMGEGEGTADTDDTEEPEKATEEAAPDEAPAASESGDRAEPERSLGSISDTVRDLGTATGSAPESVVVEAYDPVPGSALAITAAAIKKDGQPSEPTSTEGLEGWMRIDGLMYGPTTDTHILYQMAAVIQAAIEKARERETA